MASRPLRWVQSRVRRGGAAAGTPDKPKQAASGWVGGVAVPPRAVHWVQPRASGGDARRRRARAHPPPPPLPPARRLTRSASVAVGHARRGLVDGGVPPPAHRQQRAVQGAPSAPSTPFQLLLIWHPTQRQSPFGRPFNPPALPPPPRHRAPISTGRRTAAAAVTFRPPSARAGAAGWQGNVATPSPAREGHSRDAGRQRGVVGWGGGGGRGGAKTRRGVGGSSGGLVTAQLPCRRRWQSRWWRGPEGAARAGDGARQSTGCARHPPPRPPRRARARHPRAVGGASASLVAVSGLRSGRPGGGGSDRRRQRARAADLLIVARAAGGSLHLFSWSPLPQRWAWAAAGTGSVALRLSRRARCFE